MKKLIDEITAYLGIVSAELEDGDLNIKFLVWFFIYSFLAAVVISGAVETIVTFYLITSLTIPITWLQAFLLVWFFKLVIHD